MRLRHGLDHASVGDADLRDGSDARRRGEQAPPPRPHHRLQVGVTRDHDQDARTHVSLVSAIGGNRIGTGDVLSIFLSKCLAPWFDTPFQQTNIV